MIQAIFFDIDGTLMDFKAAERSAFLRAMQMRGIDRAEERYPRYSAFNKSLWESLERGEITRDELLDQRYARFFAAEGITQSAEGFESLYRANLSDEHQLMDGAIEILKYLSKKYPLYIVTNGIAATQHRRIDDADIRRFFKDVFISEEVGYAKPDKRFFDHCLKSAALSNPESILIIGDSLTSDMQGGINSGLKTCWVKQIGAVAEQSFDYEITHLSELRNFL